MKDKEYWEKEIKTWNKPHRQIISMILGSFPWFSLMEIGCGSGANLMNIVKHFPGKQIGGIEIDPLAIEVAQTQFQGALFKVGTGEDVLMSDNSTDVLLYDMGLTRVSPLKIKKYLKEARRITRNYIVLHEFHSKSFFKRLKLRLFTGKYAHNYKYLLDKLGFYNIIVYKMPILEKDNEQDFHYMITARVPKYN